VLASARMSGGNNSANYCDTGGLASDLFSRFAISFHEPWTIDQVAGRIATDA